MDALGWARVFITCAMHHFYLLLLHSEHIRAFRARSPSRPGLREPSARREWNGSFLIYYDERLRAPKVGCARATRTERSARIQCHWSVPSLRCRIWMSDYLRADVITATGGERSPTPSGRWRMMRNGAGGTHKWRPMGSHKYCEKLSRFASRDFLELELMQTRSELYGKLWRFEFTVAATVN